MNNIGGTLRRTSTIVLSWVSLWLAVWTAIGAIIEGVQPGSLDPGEGTGFVLIFGSMGLLSAIAFACLLLFGSRRQFTIDLSMIRATGFGILACAFAQIPYLGHGDQGLAANMLMALSFVAIGGIVTIAWVVLARWWSHMTPGVFLQKP